LSAAKSEHDALARALEHGGGSAIATLQAQPGYERALAAALGEDATPRSVAMRRGGGWAAPRQPATRDFPQARNVSPTGDSSATARPAPEAGGRRR
jgi:hypothetical protein